jgi:hypothetical protein
LAKCDFLIKPSDKWDFIQVSLIFQHFEGHGKGFEPEQLLHSSDNISPVAG